MTAAKKRQDLDWISRAGVPYLGSRKSSRQLLTHQVTLLGGFSLVNKPGQLGGNQAGLNESWMDDAVILQMNYN